MNAPPFSAGDVEKFSYCPLSWWLGVRGDGASPVTAAGTGRHLELNSDLTAFSQNKHNAALYSRMIMYYALISTFLAVLGVSLLDFNGKLVVSRLLLILAVLWLIIAVSLLYLAGRQFRWGSAGERWVIYMAVAAVLFALISISTLQVNTYLAHAIESVSLIWLIGASIYLHFTITAERSAAEISRARKVEGKVVYVGDDEHPVLYSSDGLFSGKPDFIVEEDGNIIPCEFKSGRKPAGPLFSHIMQLSAYCRLVEDNYGTRPDFGYIYYGSEKHAIDFDDDLERLLVSKAGEMKACIEAGAAHRNHRRAGKCAGCSRREACPERLA